MSRPSGRMRMPTRSVTCRRRAHHLTRGSEMADRICSIDGCRKPLKARDLCAMHYLRLTIHGDPMLGARPLRNETCKVDGCLLPPRGQYCSRHQARVAKYGTPFFDRKPGRPARTPEERFVDRCVLGEGSYEGRNCILWTGDRSTNGYGRFKLTDTMKNVMAHRWVYVVRSRTTGRWITRATPSICSVRAGRIACTDVV